MADAGGGSATIDPNIDPMTGQPWVFPQTWPTNFIGPIAPTEDSTIGPVVPTNSPIEGTPTDSSPFPGEEPLYPEGEVLSGSPPGGGSGPTGITPEQQAQIDAWTAEVAKRNAAQQTASTPTTNVPGQPPTQPPQLPDTSTTPQLPDMPPSQPPPPPSAEGFMPGSDFRGGSENGPRSENSFASLINAISGPGSIEGQSPNIPAWARGLMRSPHAKAQMGGRSPFATLGGFGPEEPADPELLRRQQESAGMPAWMAPGI